MAPPAAAMPTPPAIQKPRGEVALRTFRPARHHHRRQRTLAGVGQEPGGGGAEDLAGAGVGEQLDPRPRQHLAGLDVDPRRVDVDVGPDLDHGEEQDLVDVEARRRSATQPGVATHSSGTPRSGKRRDTSPPPTASTSSSRCSASARAAPSASLRSAVTLTVSSTTTPTRTSVGGFGGAGCAHAAVVAAASVSKVSSAERCIGVRLGLRRLPTSHPNGEREVNLTDHVSSKAADNR